VKPKPIPATFVPPAERAQPVESFGAIGGRRLESDFEWHDRSGERRGLRKRRQRRMDGW
jgi:hypothetical protein